MNQDTENFEQLRRLLALKRYEQPPPGYFNDFSSQVIARIKVGERGEEGAFLDRLLWEAPWLRRIWAALEAKPILAGVFGVAMCGLLIAGVIYSDRTDPALALVPTHDRCRPRRDNCGCVGGRPPTYGQPAMFESSSTNPLTTVQMGGRFWATSASFGHNPPALVSRAGTDRSN